MGITHGAAFDAQAKAAEQKVVAKATATVAAFAQQAFQDLSWDAKQASGYGSPVASGRLAGSMRIAINAVDSSTAPADPNYRYPAGRGSRPLPPRTINNVPAASVALVLRAFKLGDKINISNSVPYIRRIEIGGHSWQTPGGVFGPTIRALLARFRNVKVTIRG